MKSSFWKCYTAAFCFSTIAVASGASANLIAGLTYYKGDEALTGKLTFLLRHDYLAATNTLTASSIYEYDFARETLRKLTESPAGRFVASREGDTFCVAYWKGVWGNHTDTNVFVYSSSLGITRQLSLEGSPQGIAIAGGHVFFQLDGYGSQGNPGYYVTKDLKQEVASQIVDYDIAKNVNRVLDFPDASQWQYQHYDRTHSPRGKTNVFHFYYKGFGNRIADGKDYRDGYYSLDIATGKTQWIAELLEDNDDERFTYKSADERFIYFEGSGAPADGTKLVSSPWDFRTTRRQDPNGKKVRALHTFSRWPNLSGGSYVLLQMSPDRHYALVKLGEPVSRKAGMLPGWIQTYYLVDVTNGKTRVLLKDEAERQTTSSISPIWWVGGIK